jgi:glycosyltransferase involved in cell wall biosynthesis
MKVLLVKSKARGVDSPFVLEQMESCKKLGVTFDILNVTKGGAIGYLKAYIKLLGKSIFGNYDLIHAHYGLTGFLSVLQPFKPVVITFHGCDVNDTKTRWISKVACRLCSHSIVVEESMIEKLNKKKGISTVPCGVDTNVFHPLLKEQCRKTLGFDEQSQLILFGSSFSIPVKNAALAHETIAQMENVKLIELKDKTREEVNLLLNACDLLLLTSKREGSPMIIKEALSAECPIVSTDVGDVKMRLNGVKSTIVCTHDSITLGSAILALLKTNERSNGRQRIFDQGLDLDSIAKKIYTIYEKCVGLRER